MSAADPFNSPAAVAAVARKLGATRLPRCTELPGRVFAPGWEVTPHDDHLHVYVVPGGDDADEQWCARILGGCQEALDPSYSVRRCRASVVVVGGVAEADVLEVRRQT